MTRTIKTARFTLGSLSLGLLFLLTTQVLRAQDIRVVAEPNQSIRMGRGGYVCEGQLSHTPIDNTEDWTYEMVQCTGPIYNSYDYAALYAKRNHDEMEKLNDKLEHFNATNSATLQYLNEQGQTLNGDLKDAIEKQFQELPHDVLASVAVQNLKKNLLEYVDERLPPIKRPPPAARRTPNATSARP